MVCTVRIICHYSGFYQTQSSQAHIDEYRFHPLILMTSFLGWPNRVHMGEEISVWKMIKNLCGWEDFKSTGRNIFNILKMPVVLPFNLAMVAFTTARNIVKLVTEFLPAVLANCCALAAKRAKKASKTAKTFLHSQGKKDFYKDLVTLAKGLNIFR